MNMIEAHMNILMIVFKEQYYLFSETRGKHNTINYLVSNAVYLIK